MPRKAKSKKAKKSRILRAKRPPDRRRSYAASAPQPSDLERQIRSRVKEIAGSALDAAESNPEEFVNSLIGTYEKVKKARQMLKSNPVAARSALALMALSNMAKLAKSKLR